MMTLADVYHFGIQHFQHHQRRLTLGGGVTPRLVLRAPQLTEALCWGRAFGSVPIQRRRPGPRGRTGPAFRGQLLPVWQWGPLFKHSRI